MKPLKAKLIRTGNKPKKPLKARLVKPGSSPNTPKKAPIKAKMVRPGAKTPPEVADEQDFQPADRVKLNQAKSGQNITEDELRNVKTSKLPYPDFTKSGRIAIPKEDIIKSQLENDIQVEPPPGRIKLTPSGTPPTEPEKTEEQQQRIKLVAPSALAGQRVESKTHEKNFRAKRINLHSSLPATGKVKTATPISGFNDILSGTANAQPVKPAQHQEKPPSDAIIPPSDKTGEYINEFLDQETIKSEAPPVTKEPVIDLDENKPILSCYIFSNGAWELKELAKSSKIVRLGSNSVFTELFVEDDRADGIHLLFRYVGSEWFIIEKGKQLITSINGFEKSQEILSDTKLLLSVGDSEFVFCVDFKNNQKPATKKLGNLKLEMDAKNEMEFPCGKTIFIGSHPICDVKIGDVEFAGVISEYKNNLFLKAFNGSDITVDGKAVNSLTPLSHLCKIATGNREMTLHLPEQLAVNSWSGDIPKNSRRDLCLLEIESSDVLGDEYLLPDNGKLVLGRVIGCDLTLDSPKVSRKHAQIVIYEGSVILVDLKSGNGTYVNGHKISKETLSPGDIINFANKKFLFCYSMLEES